LLRTFSRTPQVSKQVKDSLLQVINASSDGVGYDLQSIGFQLRQQMQHRLQDVGDLKHDQAPETTIARDAVGYSSMRALYIA